MSHQPMQILPSQRSIGNEADVTFMIADFPHFANPSAGRQWLAIELLKPPVAPNPLLENGLKCQRVQHAHPHPLASASIFECVPKGLRSLVSPKMLPLRGERAGGRASFSPTDSFSRSRRTFSDFGFRTSFGFRPSDFGLPFIPRLFPARRCPFPQNVQTRETF